MELQGPSATTEKPRSLRPDQTRQKKSPLSIEETADKQISKLFRFIIIDICRYCKIYTFVN